MNTIFVRPAAAVLAASVAAVIAMAVPPEAGKQGLRRFLARDVKTDFEADDEASFGRPVSVSHDAEAVYVVDAESHEVRVFTKTGVFLAALGRKGQGPGEFDTPSDLDARDGRLYIADKFNDRVQILDRKGKFLGGFKVPFSPDQILALDGGRIAVSHLPLGLQGSEPIVRCFSEAGALLWEGMPSVSSGERTYDAFRNLHVMAGRGGDEILVVRKSDDNAIRRFDGAGRTLAPIRVPAEYAFKSITLPLPGPERVLKAFCWDAASDAGRIGLLAPDYTEDGDIGPGRLIYLIRADGSIDGVVELPAVVRKIDLDGDTINAIDDGYNLRIFRTEAR